MKFFTKEVKIAIVAIVGIVLLFFGLNFLKGMSLFSNDSSYFIKFRDISGLSASNPIYADGYQVGVVKGIDYDYEGNGEVVFFEGDYSDYEINKARRLGNEEIKKGRYRKLMED